MRQYDLAVFNLVDKYAFDICRDAIWNEDRCTWLDEFKTGTNSYETKVLGTSFYDGISGIAYFLAAYYQISPNLLIKKTIEGAVQQCLYLYNKEKKSLSFFVGDVGICYALHYSGNVLHRSDWVDNSLEILKTITHSPSNEIKIDVIEGCSGVISCLIYFNKLYPELNLEKFITTLGNLIIDKSIKTKVGTYWAGNENSNVGLCGFSHGASGMANALLDAYSISKNRTFYDCAFDAFRYEDYYFSNKESNWPDLRTNNQNIVSYSCFWCHGAPGIGISRLKALSFARNESINRDILSAINVTINKTHFKNLKNFGLCHGTLGNIDFLMEAEKLIHNDDIFSFINDNLNYIQSEYIAKNRNIPGESSSNSLSNGFMLGKAGIGYQLLKVYKSDYKSILSLDF